MPDWNSPIKSPYLCLDSGGISFSAALVWTYIGKAWVRFYVWDIALMAKNSNNKYIESGELFGRICRDRLNCGQRQSTYAKEEMRMPPKGKKKTTKVRPTSTQVTEAPSGGNLAGQEKIRSRAYQIYIEHGEQPGHELEDWLQAERELGQSLPLHAQET
jgi:hypothetical protein